MSAKTEVPVDADIVIVGAGVAGLALAIAAARAGFHIAVVEAGSRPAAAPDDRIALSDWDRRVSALTPATQRFLADLGVWSKMAEQRLGPYTDMVVWDGEGTGEIAFHAADADVSVLGHIVENAVTLGSLLAAAEATPGVTLYWEDPATGVEQLDGGAVQVVGTSGRCWRGHLVVGADGARSRVRDLTDFAVREWSYGQQAIVATLRLAGTHHQTCWQAFLPTGPLALLPLAADDCVSLVWSLDDAAVSHWAAVEDEGFIAGLNRITADRGLVVDACGPRAVFPLAQCHAIDYVRPGVALVADAAHSIHPLAGQGINLGLTDVRVLTEELERAGRLGLSPGSDAVLRRYQRRRKGENLAMMAAMEAFKRGFGSDLPLLRIVRNAGLGWVNRSAAIKHWFMRQAIS